MSDKIVDTFGLLLRTENRYGTEYLVAELVKREGNHHAPRNCSTDSWTYDKPKHLQKCYMADLQMIGFITKLHDGPKLIGFEARYSNVYAVDLWTAERMYNTLNKIRKQVIKTSASEPVDHFMALCDALKLSFVVERTGSPNGSSYDDNQWHWMSVGEGRNRYRRLISEMVDAAKAEEKIEA